MSWWLGYYLRFSSMYYCCLACFPAMYNYFLNETRRNMKLLLKIMIGLQVLNYLFLLIFWFIPRGMQGYGHYDSDGKLTDPEIYTNGVAQNAWVLSFYLFGPFWQLYFIVGMCAAFLYDTYRPSERHSVRNWGWLADVITL